MTGNPSQEISLYFHIPFCTRKCPYCHFYVLPNQEKLKRQFLNALKQEWDLRLPFLRSRTCVSIYFGGGTPALIGPDAIAEILRWIHQSGLTLDAHCEITLEANPENITPQLMEAFAAAGINRASIGVQSLNEDCLHLLGRTHSATKAIEAVRATYSAGIKNISIDLMVEVPSLSVQVWEDTLEKALSLPISHLSLYNLTIEPHTGFDKRKKELLPLLPSQDNNLAMLNTAVRTFENAGLARYEISAFAKPGFQSRHNTGYWLARPFLGLGPSAFSYWEGRRFRNCAHLNRYTKDLEDGRFPCDFEEQLPFPCNLKELLAVQIRLLEGVDLKDFEQRHGTLPKEMHETLKQLETQGFLVFENTTVKLSEQGLLFYDTVAAELI